MMGYIPLRIPTMQLCLARRHSGARCNLLLLRNEPYNVVEGTRGFQVGKAITYQCYGCSSEGQ